MNFDEKITENFTLREFVDSATAKELKIYNIPDAGAVYMIKRLVKQILQPLRNVYGRPIKITSGYRSEELNKAVGGSRNSNHIATDEHAAADIWVPEADLDYCFKWIKENCEYDELIKYTGKSKFIHVALSDFYNRKNTFINKNGKLSYA
jgi:uncharacterized protein YcbK (DUF882 family)